MMQMPRTVFVGSRQSVFVARTQTALLERGLEVSIIDPSVGYSSRVSTMFSKLRRMFNRYRQTRRMILMEHPESTVVIHYLSIDCFWLIPLLSKRFERVVGLAYGSDVLRRQKRYDFLLQFGLKKLNGITATNDNVLDALLEDFPFLNGRSPQIIRFGLPVFEELQNIDHISRADAKLRLGFDPEKKVVCLGYSASPGQRQIELMDFFSGRLEQHRDCIFVVPVQYGSQGTIADVVERCAAINEQSADHQFVALTEFFASEKSALLRRATDVLVNHSITDAFSGTVQEVVYAGSLVLAGAHLPYRKMPGYGTSIQTYENLEAVSARLHADALEEWRSFAKPHMLESRAALHELSSWDGVFDDWLQLVDGRKN
jgi:hypothetical protein